MIEQDRTAGLPSPAPTISLEAQLEASIRTPPVGRVVRTALLTLGLTLIPFVGWGTMTTMERAVLASGQLIPEGRRKTINLLEPGILSSLEVQEGQVVRKGQTLLQLDVTQAEAAADQAKAQFWSGRARLARLRAEQAEERTLTFPEDLTRAAAADPSIAAFLDAERSLFLARWSAYDGAVAVQERQITQYQEQLNGARVQREAAQAQLRSARDQVAGLKELSTQGLAARFRVLEMQRTEQSYIAAIGQFAAQESQLREAIAQAQGQVATIRLNRLSEIANDMQTTEASVATAAQQLRAATDVLQRREVVSPEDGKVVNIRAFTPGATILAGQPILDLVPVHDRLLVQAMVMPTDIEQVEVGQRVNVRLTSYRKRTMPLIPGQVIFVAADAQPVDPANANLQPVVPVGQTFYSVRAELDAETLNKIPDAHLVAGMPCEVYILGEKRTPFDYLWSPIRNAARRAFRD
ncbi:MAG: HlyD family type I secretion periplasmic adaptor subunit [Acetobacteraceae bacterium]|nr:HlyD family type I secretion periplasmic adaptor subunit [Acetobacteraceae bacterium]